jgi:hypothetical protein
MLVDGGTTISLMSYSVFKRLGRDVDELVKTNLTLNDMLGNPMEARGIISMELTKGSKLLATHSSLSRCKVSIVSFFVVIGFTPIIVFLLFCTNS